MIDPYLFSAQREAFFCGNKNRIHAVTLKKDSVIPTLGVREALGPCACASMLEELDFPFDYTHQIPFPSNKNIPSAELYGSFRRVFDRAGEFLN